MLRASPENHHHGLTMCCTPSRNGKRHLPRRATRLTCLAALARTREGRQNCVRFAYRGPQVDRLHVLELKRNVDLPLVVPKKPAQTNSCDCGIFVLRYLEEFLARAVGAAPSVAVTEAAVDDKFAADDFASWFTPADVAAMRRELITQCDRLRKLIVIVVGKLDRRRRRRAKQ